MQMSVFKNTICWSSFIIEILLPSAFILFCFCIMAFFVVFSDMFTTAEKCSRSIGIARFSPVITVFWTSPRISRLYAKVSS